MLVCFVTSYNVGFVQKLNISIFKSHSALKQYAVTVRSLGRRNSGKLRVMKSNRLPEQENCELESWEHDERKMLNTKEG